MKLFELRDRATFIPIFAFRAIPAYFEGSFDKNNWLLARAGFGSRGDSHCVIIGRLNCAGIQRNCTYDPFAWNDRTFETAHQYIEKHFDELEDGQVIDVEYILGETEKPKESEQDKPRMRTYQETLD
jgi:hypothetical protein